MTSSAQNSNQFLAKKGSVTAPSYSFLGANTNGMYLSGTNQLGFVTAGAVAATITSAGDVGIGVTSPVAKLDVAGSIYSRPGNTVGAIAILTADAGSGANGISLSANFASGGFGPIKFVTSGTEQMRLTAAGDVGIGTSSPATKLDVNGASVLRGTVNITSGNNLDLYNSDNTNQFTINNIGATGSTNAGLSFVSSGVSERMCIDSNGNVGIGVTSPIAKLDVAGTIYSRPGDAAGAIAILTADAGSGANGISLSASFASGGFGPIKFVTSGTEVMRIDSAGNVGIGNTNANVKLILKGASSTSGDFVFYTANSSATATFLVRNDGYISTGGAASSPYNLTTGNAANVYVDSAGGLSRSTSSLRYKNSIQNAAYGLNDVLKLRAVTYKNNNDGDHVFGGFIAEEVDATGLKEFVSYDKEGRPDALHYANMAALMAKAIQELSAKNDALEARLAKLETV